MLVKIKKLDNFDPSFALPTYGSAQASGADVLACLPESKSIELKPFERILIPTGLSFEIPLGYEIQVRPRSGLSIKTGLVIVNSPGTIDSDYRGELKIIVSNFSSTVETIEHGLKIAQLVLAPVIQMKLEVSDLSESIRGPNGFGSTGYINETKEINS